MLGGLGKVVTVKVNEASGICRNEDVLPYTEEQIYQIEKKVWEAANVDPHHAVELALLVALKTLERTGVTFAELVIGDISMRVNVAEASPKPTYCVLKLTTEPKIK